MLLTIYLHQFRWLSEGGGNFLNLLQKEGVTQKGGVPSEKGGSYPEETMLIVLTGMNYDEANTIYEQAKEPLKEYKGDQKTQQIQKTTKKTATKNSTNPAPKLDAPYLAEIYTVCKN